MLEKYKEEHPVSESSSSSDDEKETHGWVQAHYDESYFTLSTGKYKGYKPGDQVFNCYGSRSNKYLLFNYGFMLKHNPYNSLKFRAWVDHQIPENNRITHILGSTITYENVNQVIRWFRVIHLKDKLNYKLLEYIRSTLIDKYEGKNRNLLIISQPIDVEFETIVLA